MKINKNKKISGLSLLEALISTAIVGIGFEAILQMTNYSVQSIYTNKEKVYIDHFNINEFSAISLIRGEDHSYAIALASIIAKVHRDNIMTKFSSVYPNYLFEKNKGYGTREHLDMLQKYGPCTIHRTSFNLGPKLQQQK